MTAPAARQLAGDTVHASEGTSSPSVARLGGAGIQKRYRIRRARAASACRSRSRSASSASRNTSSRLRCSGASRASNARCSASAARTAGSSCSRRACGIGGRAAARRCATAASRSSRSPSASAARRLASLVAAIRRSRSSRAIDELLGFRQLTDLPEQRLRELLAERVNAGALLDPLHPFLQVALRLVQRREPGLRTLERRGGVGDLGRKLRVLGGNAGRDIGLLCEAGRRQRGDEAGERKANHDSRGIRAPASRSTVHAGAVASRRSPATGIGGRAPAARQRTAAALRLEPGTIMANLMVASGEERRATPSRKRRRRLRFGARQARGLRRP